MKQVCENCIQLQSENEVLKKDIRFFSENLGRIFKKIDFENLQKNPGLLLIKLPGIINTVKSDEFFTSESFKTQLTELIEKYK